MIDLPDPQLPFSGPGCAIAFAVSIAVWIVIILLMALIIFKIAGG